MHEPLIFTPAIIVAFALAGGALGWVLSPALVFAVGSLGVVVGMLVAMAWWELIDD